MTKTTLFQALEDRENPDYIENNGPFECKWNNTWLGSGYYFWDAFKKNAEWWGTARYGNSYVICKAEFSYNHDNCLDLINEKHLQSFNETVQFLRKKGLFKENTTTVAKIIAFLKKTNSFKYSAVRAHDANSIKNPDFKRQIKFEEGRGFNLDLEPPYQICIYKPLSNSKLSNYKIIYPEEYVEVV
ncbi:hypothetical protein [Tenacibaculum mesophilum]|uniref:hypothetical protein n=1 Tax=Tenacibaculum mesophilum TaxID=104268 RepID=UPI00064B5601|nr:hypothetical protein [Tenacibaculum mesophilum]